MGLQNIGEVTVPDVVDSRVIIMLPKDSAGRIKLRGVPVEFFQELMELALEGMHVNPHIYGTAEKAAFLNCYEEIIDSMPDWETKLSQGELA